MCNVLDHNMSDYLHLGASTSPMQLKLKFFSVKMFVHCTLWKHL